MPARLPGAGSTLPGLVTVHAMRSRPGSRDASSTNGRAGGGAHHASPVSSPARTSSSAAASATVRAMGPFCESRLAGFGAGDTRPRDGLMPYTPQHDDGIRMEPPPSEPCATAHMPAATAAAAPPDEPPGVRSRSHGLREGPYACGSVHGVVPNSGVFVFPRTMNPASRMRRTGASSACGMYSAYTRDPYVVRTPSVASRSLMEIGTPWKGASLAVASAVRAWSSARSRHVVTYALSFGFSSSIRAP